MTDATSDSSIPIPRALPSPAFRQQDTNEGASAQVPTTRIVDLSPIAQQATHPIAATDPLAHPVNRLWAQDDGAVARILAAAKGSFVQHPIRVVAGNGTVEDQLPSYLALSPDGGSVALIPVRDGQQPLGRYEIGRPISGQDTYQRTGVVVAAVQGRLAVPDGASFAFTHLLSGALPACEPSQVGFDLPVAARRPVPMHGHVDVRLPTGHTLSWDEASRRRAKSGAFAFGWRGSLSAGGRKRDVFIKVVKDQEAYRAILRAEERLRDWGMRNRSIAEIVPTSLASFDQPHQSHGLEFVENGAGLVIERYHAGCTVKEMSAGQWQIGENPQGTPSLHTCIGVAGLAAHALDELNRGTVIGRRRFAPDFTKPDNLIVTSFRVEPNNNQPLPLSLVCPDRDSFVDERDHATSFRGNVLFLDMATIAQFTGKDLFDRIDAVHVFSVGRMLLDIVLPPLEALRLPDDWDSRPPEEMFRLQDQAYADSLRACEVRHGRSSSSVGREMIHLIRRCCHPELGQRPTLAEVAQQCASLSQEPLASAHSMHDPIVVRPSSYSTQ